MSKEDKNNIIKVILKNNKVNNYTKLMIILNTLNYYDDNYIPNKKLMNMLNINKNRIIVLLHQLENDDVIRIFYKGRKRYFTFIAIENREEEPIKYGNEEVFEYDWLND